MQVEGLFDAPVNSDWDQRKGTRFGVDVSEG